MSIIRDNQTRTIELKEIDLPFMLVGDYNLYYIWWNAPARNPTREAKELVDWLDKYNC